VNVCVALDALYFSVPANTARTVCSPTDLNVVLYSNNSPTVVTLTSLPPTVKVTV